ncbi:MAG: hypothetical protein JXP73_10050 [Deltaproteobacteria bacterium]|nr:hypothetical protein [Deltaproteobacteria bacterium]
MKNLAVSVTGVGAISPLGTGMDALRTREIASRQCRLSPTEQKSAGSGLAEDLAEQGSRATFLAIAASRMALAGRGDGPLPETAGIVLGTSLPDLGALEQHRHTFDSQGGEALSPSILHFSLPLSHAGFAAVTLGLSGPIETHAEPVLAGLSAIGHAARAVAGGESELLLAGGVDSPTGLGLARPLRDALGIEPSEACAILALEPAAGTGHAVAIEGFASRFVGADVQRKAALVRAVANGDLDTVIAPESLPDPLPGAMAGAAAMACAWAALVLERRDPPPPPPGWARDLSRPGEVANRIVVFAEGPSGFAGALLMKAARR